MTHNLKKLNKQATKIFTTLIHNLNEEEPHRRIGGEIGKSAIMPVCVELLYKNSWGRVFSIAHYYIQNGDLMADPDMEFLVDSEGAVYPMSFYQASYGAKDLGAWFDYKKLESKEPMPLLHSRYRAQKDQAVFAGKWMKNIKEQQSTWFKGGN